MEKENKRDNMGSIKHIKVFCGAYLAIRYIVRQGNICNLKIEITKPKEKSSYMYFGSF